MGADQLNALLNRLRMGGGERKLPAFATAKGKDWIAWRNNFRLMCGVKGWDDVTARNNLAAAMEGEANIRVQDISIPFAANPATGLAFTTAELLLAYDRIFLPEAGGQLARSQFQQAKQRAEGEDILQWHSRLRALYCRSNPFGDLEHSRELIERFITGLVDPEVKDRTWNDFPRTFTEALDSATKRHAALMLLRKPGRIHGPRHLCHWGGKAGEGASFGCHCPQQVFPLRQGGTLPPGVS